MSVETVFRATVGLPASSGEIDPARFREIMSNFPAAVSVITALDEQGNPRGLTCSACCSLSMDPPLMLACINQRNGSLRAIRHSRGFVVNLLRWGRDEVSARFASGTADKYAGVVWQASPASGLPHLREDAVAHIDCELVADIAAGSHVILIGRIRACDANDVSQQHVSPLLYWRRTYGSLSKAGASSVVTDQASPTAGDHKA